MSQSHSQEAPSSQVSENLEGTGSQQSPAPASSESLSEELQPQASSSRRVVLIDQESTLLATSSEPLSVDLQHQASGSRRVVLIDQEPPLLAASQADTKKPKRKSKSLLKRNQSRLDTHKYLQAHPEVVPEFVEALKHKEKSSLESSSSQATTVATHQQPSSPVSDRPANFLATAPQVNHPETEVQFTVTLDGVEQSVSEAEPEIDLDCGSEFEMSS